MTAGASSGSWVVVSDPAGHRAAAAAAAAGAWSMVPAGLRVVVPDAGGVWLCDVCNRLLVGAGGGPSVEPLVVGPDGWGVVCAACRDRYHGGAAATLAAASACDCSGCCGVA